MSQPPAAPSNPAPITFIVQGQRVPGGVQGAATRSGGPANGGTSRPLPGTVKTSVRLGALRGTAQPHTVTAVPGEDVVALHIAGGPVLLLHPENARDLLLAQAGAATTTRGGQALSAAQAAGAGVPVAATLRWQGLEAATPTRGLLGDVVLAAFEVLTGLAKDEVVDFAASQVVARVDGQVEAGVYTLSPDSLPPLKGSGRRLATLPPASGPVLVMIHGTFVETTSTFGKLWAQHAQRVRQLFQHYGGRVYALEHETLGRSPIDNALELVKALPQGTRLHLLTHSRGGLVAEVLARMAHQRRVGAADEAFFAGAAYAAQRAALRELAAEMAAREITVERVVRVACPARGTLLASKRLDAYLSVFKWALEATGLPLLPAVMDFLGEVARRRADPALLPGMAAMIAGAPLLEWLNAAPAPIAGELRVVAGDLQGDSLGSWLKTLVTDAYYWTDHDIVVQTSSMYAGAPRAGGASFLLDQGGKTTHFAYFVNPATVDAVVDGLLQGPLPRGFAPIGPLSWAGRSAEGVRGAAEGGTAQPDKPAVFVLPGILGSNLAVDGRRIWLGLGLVGGLGQLAYTPDDNARVQPDGAISLIYDKLMRHLRSTHEVVEFAFDWRLPLEQEARRLAAAVTAALDARTASGSAVQILAHSMGGVLARCMALEAPAVWQRLMAHPQARLLMLGTPNGGSWAPMQVLSGDDSFGNALAAFGSPLADRAARRVMAGLPGFLQLQAGLLDPKLGLDQEATWARLADDDYTRMQQANWWHRHAGEAMQAAYHWGVPPQAVLDAAKALRQRLDAQREQALPQWAHKLALVVGRAPATPVGFEVGEQGLVYLDAPDGDGRVPLDSALLPGVATWQLGCDHGSLPSETSAFAAYVELLNTGQTAALPPLLAGSATRGTPAGTPTTALQRSRPARQRRSARPAALEDAVFRSPAGADATPAAAAGGGGVLQLRVLNGNLSFMAEPLLIGHYTASELTGTEGVVDRMLGGGLQRALAAGLYPAAVGTHQVFVNTRRDPANCWREPRPQAVLVVGLGEEGELREAGLTESVRQGVLAWAQRQAEAQGRSGPAPGAGSTTLAATLLGSGGLGISPAAAARAIARGVAEANQRATASGWPAVQRLTLVELYLDRATDAWNGLRLLAEGQGSGTRFELLPEIASGTGPLRRQLDNGYRGTDHDLIRATTREDGSLEYVLDTRRARTEVRSLRPQTPLLRELLNAAATDRNDDPGIGRTLFQLLVPTEIEPFLNGVDRMVLELDAGTAALPWELLDTGPAGAGGGVGGDAVPWALRSKLLRRLQKSAPAAPPRDASADHDVLVIGEPLVGPEWAPLPAAREEALAVQEALCEAGGLAPERVLALVDSPAAPTVIGALLSRPWRIVHISGHGEAPSALNAGGVVLSGGHHLGPAEIEAMRVVPELVFVNCCSLAQYDDRQALRPGFDPGVFAAVVADQLIAKGVRCVIACGWPVNDGPAAEFARVFYAQLLRGARFIDAVAEARTACWRAMPHGKSWAAYQCYGDANWVYRQRSGDAQAPTAAPQRDEFADIASPPALALALETLATRARYMGGHKPTLTAALQQLVQRFEPRWGGIGAVAEAFAVAWQALGDRPQAITWYGRAVAAADASASFKAEEQMLNLSARQAWADASEANAAGADLDAQRQRLQGAVAALQQLCAARPSAERWSLLGSACKRLYLLERQAGDAHAARSALQQAFAAYRDADHLLQPQGPEASRCYPLQNAFALALCLDADGRAFGAEDRAALASAQAAAALAPDFWSEAGRVEARLWQALGEGRLAAEAEALQRAFEDLHGLHPARHDWASVADQAELVLAPHTGRGGGATARAAQALLVQLQGYGAAPGAAS